MDGATVESMKSAELRGRAGGPRGRLPALVGRIRSFVERDLWIMDLANVPVWRRRFTNTAKIAVLFASGFAREKIQLRAAALTYLTLLSFVPALAVVFSIFTAFGGLKQMESAFRSRVLETVVGTEQSVIIEHIDKFVSSINAGALGGVGTAVLFYTVVSTVSNIERAFNDIWGIKRDRTLLQKFQVYWPLLTLGPVLLGLSLTLTASFQSSSVVVAVSAAIPGLWRLLKLTPLVFTCATFTLLYVIMPNTKVRLQSAALGGAVAGMAWELAKWAYAYYAKNAISYSQVYGALAAIPLFILWIDLSWVMVLLGAQLAFANQNARTYAGDGLALMANQSYREVLAVRVLAEVAAEFQHGRAPLPRTRLVNRLGAPSVALGEVLAVLCEAGVLIECGDGSDSAYTPARPLASLDAAEVVSVLRERIGVQLPLVNDSMTQVVRGVLASAGEASRKVLAHATAEDLARRTAPPGPTAPDPMRKPGSQEEEPRRA